MAPLPCDAITEEQPRPAARLLERMDVTLATERPSGHVTRVPD